MRASRAWAVVLTTVWAGAAQAQGAKDTARVQADVRAQVAALFAGDVETALRMAHPSSLEAAGGVAKARAILEGVARQAQTQGVKQESLDFPEPPTFVRGKQRLFAIVPVHMIITVSGQRVESWSFQVGIRDDGSTNWTYVEGPRLAASRERWFADLPQEVRLPRVASEVQ